MDDLKQSDSNNEHRKEEKKEDSVSSVMAAMTWTRQIGKCQDPNCVQIHIDGQHAWKSDGGDSSRAPGDIDLNMACLLYTLTLPTIWQV